MKSLLNILGIQNYSNLSIPKSSEIESILNEIVSPEFQKLGLTKSNHKYVWEGNVNEKGIKKIIRFTYRGMTGNFMIGSNLNFVSEYNSVNKLVHNKIIPQLYENLTYFSNEDSLSLWNKYFLKKTLKKNLQKTLPKISVFLKELETINGNINLADRQLNSSNFEYKIHSPNPKYVLSFLYLQMGEKENAIKLMKEYLEKNPQSNKEILNKLNVK